MAKSTKFDGDGIDRDDMRVALKLPKRGSLENRQIASAFKSLKKILRSSSSGRSTRSTASKRQRGQAAAGAAKASGSGAGAATGKASLMQRVSVRWTYSGNQGDGQWGAHGRYIERESAQDKNIDQKRDAPDLDQDAGRVPDQNPNHTKENHEPERSSIPLPIGLRGRAAGISKSYLDGFGGKAQAKSFDSVRNLSGVGVGETGGRDRMFLQGNAPENVLQRGTEGTGKMRRSSGSDDGVAGQPNARLRHGPAGFGSGGPDMHVSATLDEWQRHGDERMFKLIISPEFGERMNLRKHVSELMQQMEKDLGTKLEWVAVDHYNTAHPHAHVAVRGVDDRGRGLEVSREYIAVGSRARAQELATRELGYRSERDVALATERQVTQQRFTDIDRRLLKMGNEQGTPNVDAGLLKAAQQNPKREIDFSSTPPNSERMRAVRLAQVERLAFLEKHGLATRTGEMKWQVSPELATRKPDTQRVIQFDAKPPISTEARETRLVQIRRLAQLTEMGLADKVGNLTWRLNPTLETALRQMQMSQDRLKTRFAHREMISDPAAPLQLTELKMVGDRVAGKLVGTGLNEETNKPYLLLEGFDGKVHYLNQSAQVQKLRGAGTLKAGDFVSLEMAERKDRTGKVVGTMQKVVTYGRQITSELLDAELLAGGKVIEPATLKKSVAGAFRDAAAARLATLQHAGAVAINGAHVQRASAEAHDQVRYQDKGIRAERFDGKGPILATVVQKGEASVAVAPSYGRKLVISAQQLDSLGLPHKYLSPESFVFIGVDAKQKSVASAVRLDQVPPMIQDRRINKLDAMLQQLQPIQIPPGHALHEALRDRAAIWEKRGVDPHGPDFALKANVWRKSVELHEAAQQKGVDKVIEQLALEKGKEVRDLACAPGRQVTGRVVLVQAEGSDTTVLIDSGSHYTRLRVPAPDTVAAKAGDRVRARPQEIAEATATQRRVMWQFADLEREEARTKGREGKSF